MKMAYVVFLFVVLVVIAVFPAIAEARYDEVYAPTVESTDLTVPSYKVADEIDPVAIVTYTLQKEVEDAEAKANGETLWYEDPEWQAACALIESWPEHQIPYEVGVE